MVPLPIHYTEVEDIYSRTFGNGISTLAIASAVDGEGVSTLAYALSQRAAAMGHKTLLVDFNRRNPSVAQRLGIVPCDWSPGDPSALSMIVPLSKTGLHILSAPSGGSECLSARETSTLKACFKRWQKQFDYIVADTSPLTIQNQSNFPPENVCAACEGTILVVLTGRTSETLVLESFKKLESSNANVIGSVLNDRHTPALSDELVRETRRFDGFALGIMEKLRGKIHRSTFLNQSI
jgi:Mrp family chromosome partitioning ATPase